MNCHYCGRPSGKHDVCKHCRNIYLGSFSRKDKKKKKSIQKSLIKFEYKDGTIEGGVYEPPLKEQPADLIYFKVVVCGKTNLFRMTTDEASCLIACIGIALNQVLSPCKK